MDKKLIVKIVKIIIIIIILLGLIYTSLWYLEKKGYIKTDLFKGTIVGYGPYGDPCDIEPGVPDPCGGS